MMANSETKTHYDCVIMLSLIRFRIAHFTVVCLVAWPLNENEAGGDLVLIESLLIFSRKSLLISMKTASLTKEKQGGLSK